MTELVHFYSYATGVSLELPVGFESVARDEASASYAVLGDDDVTAVPGTQLLVQVVGEVPDGTDATTRDAQVDALAGALAARGGEVVDRAERVVDEERVVSTTLRDADGMLVLAAAAATPHRLVSILGLARDEETLAVHQAAVESIRFIEL